MPATPDAHLDMMIDIDPVADNDLWGIKHTWREGSSGQLGTDHQLRAAPHFLGRIRWLVFDQRVAVQRSAPDTAKAAYPRVLAGVTPTRVAVLCLVRDAPRPRERSATSRTRITGHDPMW